MVGPICASSTALKGFGFFLSTLTDNVFAGYRKIFPEHTSVLPVGRESSMYSQYREILFDGIV